MTQLTMTCTCAERQREGEYPDCEIHVACDVWCMALDAPVSKADVVAAYVHWRLHNYLAGCSHAN